MMIKSSIHATRNKWSELTVLILIALLILLQILNERGKVRTLGEGGGEISRTLVWRSTPSCWTSQRSLFLKIPDCESLPDGTVIVVIGTLEDTSDNQVFSQKRMIVAGYTVIEPAASSPLYWHALSARWAAVVKAWLVTPLRQSIAYPEEVLVESFVLGSGVVLPEAIEHSIKVIGIAHVIAVSGSHLTLLIGILFMIIKANNRLISTSIIMIILLIYVTVVGWQGAVTRALVMCAILILGKTVLHRQVSFARSLVMSALLMTVYNPWVVFNIGWQLSVLATAGICWIYPVLSRHILIRWDTFPQSQSWTLQYSSRVFKLSLEATLASIAAAALIWPILVENFGVWSWGSVLSSVFLWWLFPLVISSCFVGVIVVRVLSLVSVHQSLLQIPSSLLLEWPVRSVTWLFEQTVYLEWMLIETGSWSQSVYVGWYLVVVMTLLLEDKRQSSRVSAQHHRLGPL